MIPAAFTSLPSNITGILDLFEKVEQGVGQFTNLSLTQYTKPCMVMSRVYIDETIFHEPVVKDVLRSLHTLYVGLVLNALQVNRYVTKERTVQDLLRVVSTESMEDFVDIAAAFEDDHQSDDELAAIVAHNQEYLRKKAEEEARTKLIEENIKKQEKAKKDNLSKKEQELETRDRDLQKREGKLRDEKAKIAKPWVPGVTGKITNLAGDGTTPVGRMLEVTLQNPENKDASVTLNILVQIIPYVVSADIAYKLIAMDAIPSTAQRWLQFKAGEISFWRDFLGGVDLLKKKQHMIHTDRNGALRSYLDHQSKSRAQALASTIGAAAANPNRRKNIASTMLVLSSEAITKAKLETNIDFNKPADRQRFFANAMVMIVAIVDTMYNTVTLYYNGLDDAGTYTFDQFAKGDKSGDSPVDLIKALAAFAGNKAPRF